MIWTEINWWAALWWACGSTAVAALWVLLCAAMYCRKEEER
jgi:hypothetical protein